AVPAAWCRTRRSPSSPATRCRLPSASGAKRTLPPPPSVTSPTRNRRTTSCATARRMWSCSPGRCWWTRIGRRTPPKRSVTSCRHRANTRGPGEWALRRNFYRRAADSPGVAGAVHQLGFELGQLVVVVVNSFESGGDGGIIIHERDECAVGGHVVNRQHGPDAAVRPQAGVAVLLVDL